MFFLLLHFISNNSEIVIIPLHSLLLGSGFLLFRAGQLSLERFLHFHDNRSAGDCFAIFVVNDHPCLLVDSLEQFENPTLARSVCFHPLAYRALRMAIERSWPTWPGSLISSDSISLATLKPRPFLLAVAGD